MGNRYSKQELDQIESLVADGLTNQEMRRACMHLGKDIVAATLRATGFQVVDLGVDVSSKRFVDAAARAREGKDNRNLHFT